MGFWANLLTHKKKRAEQFEDASRRIRKGVALRLERRYAATQDSDRAPLMAAAVLADVFCRKNVEDDVRAFMKSNRKLLTDATTALRDDPEIGKALSWLFLVVDGIMQRQPKAFQDDFAGNPLEKIRELGLFIEGTREPLVDDFLAFAREFYEASPGIE